MSTNTAVMSYESVVSRILESKASDLRKAKYLADAARNMDRPDDLIKVHAMVVEFDKDFEASLRARNAQRMTDKEANNNVFVPDMKGDEKKKEEIKMTKALYNGKEETAIIKKAFKRGTEGEHTVTLIGVKGNNGWKQLRFVDENYALYETGVWTLVDVDPKFNFTTDDGEELNACELSRISKVVCRIIGHGSDGDIYGNAYNKLDDMEGSPAEILKKLIADKVQLKVAALPNGRWDGKKPSKEFKLYFCEPTLDEACVEQFGGFVDDFDNLPTGDEPETVSYNDHIDSSVKKNFAPRPTEEAAC